jgi:hypothetical protein
MERKGEERCSQCQRIDKRGLPVTMSSGAAFGVDGEATCVIMPDKTTCANCHLNHRSGKTGCRWPNQRVRKIANKTTSEVQKIANKRTSEVQKTGNKRTSGRVHVSFGRTVLPQEE